MTATVRAFEAHEWRTYRALRLEALRDAPHAFGSTLAREEAFSEQDWITRLAAGVASSLDQPLVAEASGRAVGLAWVRIDSDYPSAAALYQVWVHPDFRERGVGRSLLDSAMTWARQSKAEMMILSVTEGPGSAIDFYRGAGFEEVGPAGSLRPGSERLQQPMRRML